jgi:hypothetical protein
MYIQTNFFQIKLNVFSFKKLKNKFKIPLIFFLSQKNERSTLFFLNSFWVTQKFQNFLKKNLLASENSAKKFKNIKKKFKI